MLNKLLHQGMSATVYQTESTNMGERFNAYLDDFPFIEAYGQTKEIALDKLSIVMKENGIGRTI